MHLSISPLSEEEGGGIGGYGGGEGFGENGRRGRGRVCMSTEKMEGEEGNQSEWRGTEGLGDSRGGERTAGLCW